MPHPTPFHERTSQLCTSLFFKEWAGCYAVRSYGTCHEREYYALRHAAGLIDVTPLFKYEVHGPGAGDFLARLMVKDVRKLKPGRVTYLCWCDEEGKVVDDGTVTRLDETRYRVTAAEPCLSWMLRYARGYDVVVEDSSDRFGALAVQGPRSREILVDVAGEDIAKLRFFRFVLARIADVHVLVSRTGYTGDLGYEVWVERDDAVKVYDAVLEAGRSYGALPAGLDAMDVTRVEAGFIMNGVDYFSAHQCFIESRKSTPYELNLGWTVQLDREPFVGQAALRAEAKRGSKWAFVGLVVDWEEYEAVYAEHGLPPQVPSAAWRDPRPVYAEHGAQVGRATSGAFSPVLKKNLALASVTTPFAEPGTRLKLEVTAEFERRSVSAVVTPLPFFDPERKRA